MQGGYGVVMLLLLLRLRCLLLSPVCPSCLSAAFILPEGTKVCMHSGPRPLRQ